MVAERVYRVAYVETNKSEAETRELFSQCGDIRGIYPWSPRDRQNTVHFFVEFSHQGSVKRARALRLPEDRFRVHILAFSPDLIATFTTVCPPAYPSSHRTKPDSHHEDHGSHSGSSSGWISSDRKSSGRKPPTHPRSSRQFTSRSNPHYSSRRTGHSNEHSRNASQSYDKENGNRLQHVHMYDQLAPSSSNSGGPFCRTAMPDLGVPTPITVSQSHPQKMDLFSPSYLSPAISVPTTSSVPTVKPEPVSEMIDLAVPEVVPSGASIVDMRGEQFTWDLEALTESPENVIFTLSKTAISPGDRGKWMVVAARYRTKGDLPSAIAVVSAMVHVMSSPAVGLAEAELRPAFLMLASCYSDLGKRVQVQMGVHTDASREYMNKAQEYLQKVYGTASPPLSTDGMTGRATSSVQVSAGARKGPMVDALVDTTTRAAGNSLVTQGKEDMLIRIRTLERGMQSFRDKHSHSITALAEERDAKRKLEGDFRRERAARLKFEKDLEQTALDLQGARHAERCALEQCRREVENRRRAEQKAEDIMLLEEELRVLRDELNENERKVRESMEREKKRKEFCATAGALLIKAAKGEFEDIGNLVANSVVTTSSSSWKAQTPCFPIESAAYPRRERTITGSVSSKYAHSSPMRR